MQIDDPFLFEGIMLEFGGYRSFLRQIRRPMPPTTKKERAFINYSSKASLNYFANCWSSLEEITWAILVKMKLNDRFIHNCLFPSPTGHYYKLDFFDPIGKRHISVDGVFHTAISSQKLRDQEKDRYLEGYGIQTLHLTSEIFKDWNQIEKLLRSYFRL